MFFLLINDYYEFFFVEFDAIFYFSFNIIVPNIILKLWPPWTQNFLNFINILSGSRDIRKRKKKKNSEDQIYEKLAILKSF